MLLIISLCITGLSVSTGHLYLYTELYWWQTSASLTAPSSSRAFNRCCQPSSWL